MYFLRQRTILINLVLMCFVWISVIFTYYLISYNVKYLPGNVFENSLAISISNVVASLATGTVYGPLKFKKTFLLSFTVSTVGGLLILFLGDKESDWMPLFVLVS